MRVATWNVNGIRARHREVVTWADRERPDVLCLQELKAAPEQVPERLTTLADYWSFWHGRLGGYSGVSLHLRRATFPERPVFAHPSFDHEARVVEVTVCDLVLASVYVPNGGKDYAAKLTFLSELGRYVGELGRAGKRVLFCGDFNVTRTERDVHPRDRNQLLVCQRPEERALFEGILGHGLIDVGRRLRPDDDGYYTWWPQWRGARLKNRGWRLDYLLASAALAERAVAEQTQRDYGTSDHAPVIVDFDSLWDA